MSFNNDNLLGKSIQSERKHYDNPLLRNVQSDVDYHWGSDPEGRGRIGAYIPNWGDPDNPLFFQYASPLDQMLKVLTMFAVHRCLLLF